MGKSRFGDGASPGPRTADYRLNRPLTGQPWIDCHICSFSIPQGEGIMHYKMKKLVCANCNDELGHQDYMERRKPVDEGDRVSVQPVKS